MRFENNVGFLNPHLLYANFKDYIKKDQLVDGGLYVICARQAYVGMWSNAEDGFVIARNKAISWFLFTEHHWDEEFYFDGKLVNRGTAMPLKDDWLYI